MNLAMPSRFSMRQLLLVCAVAAAVILGAALVAQYGFGLYPCELCMYQRYPYMAIIALGLFGAFLIKSERWRFALALLCGVLFLTTAGIAFYHAGVEWGIFTGPTACSSAGSPDQTLEEMREALRNAPLVPCDQPMAKILGLSLAGWNAIVAFALALFTFAALRHARKHG
jgi:disulfide bond formation protein DsbB